MNKVVFLILGLLLGACSLSPKPPAAELRVVISNQSINLQEHRLALSVWERNNNYTDIKSLHILATSPNESIRWEGQATRHSDYPVEYWVVSPPLEILGEWRLQITLKTLTTQDSQHELTIVVEDHIQGLAAGMAAYPSQTPILDEGVQFYQITSDFSPRPGFYNLSIDQALQNGQPTIIVFAAPGLCIDPVNMFIIDYTMELVWREYGNSPLNIIHVEMYSPQTNGFIPAMQEWGIAIQDNLDSFLPWTYLVGADGIIRARYDGVVAFSELAPQIDEMLAQAG